MLRRLTRWLTSPPPARPSARPPAAQAPPVGAPGLGARLGVPEPDQPRELVLYKFDACPYCARVMRVVEQLDIALAMEDTRQDPSARRALMTQTGRTTVPCLFIDGQPLFESADIIDWLEAYAS